MGGRLRLIHCTSCRNEFIKFQVVAMILNDKSRGVGANIKVFGKELGRELVVLNVIFCPMVGPILR